MTLRSVISAFALSLALVLSSASEPVAPADASAVAGNDWISAVNWAGTSAIDKAAVDDASAPLKQFGQITETLCGCPPGAYESSEQVRGHARPGGSIPAFRALHCPKTIPSVEESAARILLSANRSGMRTLQRYIYSICFLLI